ncbi:MAG TPA: ribonuclease HII [Candidatus Polarisedimenticolia bacterium]|nr:ribonuclease HII [Candidatus Polarisedimenticolia bacterium]
MHEDRLRKSGHRLIAGLDEVGRGSLAGPVVAAAVILDRGCRLPGVKDSKVLREPLRRRQFGCIVLSAVAYGFGVADAEMVDRMNVYEATREAMRQALASLASAPDALLLDAMTLPDLPLPQVSLIHGDRRCLSIAAASILAKVYRDEMMKDFDSIYPAYRFSQNKGYGTLAHRRIIGEVGLSPLHRRTFSVRPPRWEEGP